MAGAEAFDPLAGIRGDAEGELVDGYCDTHGPYQASRIFGRAPCPECTRDQLNEHAVRAQADRERAQRDARIRAIGLPKRYQGAELSQFEDASQHEQAKTLIDCVQKGDHVQALILGPVGTGKTHFAAALAKALAQAEGAPSPLYASSAGYLRALRATFDNPDRRTDSVFQEYAQAGVLFLDDIGAGTEYSNDVWRLHELIDYRYCEELPTVYISNLPVSKNPDDNQLSTFIGTRAYDRMRENAVLIRMLGDTRRRPK